jgi:hypothetical protein
MHTVFIENLTLGHSTGRRNAQQAVAYFVSNLPGVPAQYKSQYAANDTLIIYAGHSMGGHGVSFRAFFFFFLLFLRSTIQVVTGCSASSS